MEDWHDTDSDLGPEELNPETEIPLEETEETPEVTDVEVPLPPLSEQVPDSKKEKKPEYYTEEKDGKYYGF